MNNLAIEVSCGYRIHINSIDMNGFNARICGGLGFCLDEPRVKVVASISEGSDAMPVTLQPVLAPLLQEFREREKVSAFYNLVIDGPIHFHKGLGSTTVLKLCVLSALYKLNGGLLTKRMANRYGIGLVSGISVNAFFGGGFLVDGGYPTNNATEKALNGESQTNPAPLLFRKPFPKNWRIFLAVPKNLQSLDGESEAAFFDRITPIDNAEVNQIAYNVLMRVMPGLLEKNFELFSAGIKNIVARGTKKFERELHLSHNKALLAQMENDFGFASVTSLGPSVYAITDKAAAIEAYQSKFPGYLFYFTGIANTGHQTKVIAGQVPEQQ